MKVFLKNKGVVATLIATVITAAVLFTGCENQGGESPASHTEDSGEHRIQVSSLITDFTGNLDTRIDPSLNLTVTRFYRLALRTRALVRHPSDPFFKEEINGLLKVAATAILQTTDGDLISTASSQFELHTGEGAGDMGFEIPFESLHLLSLRGRLWLKLEFLDSYYPSVAVEVPFSPDQSTTVALPSVSFDSTESRLSALKKPLTAQRNSEKTDKRSFSERVMAQHESKQLPLSRIKYIELPLTTYNLLHSASPLPKSQVRQICQMIFLPGEHEYLEKCAKDPLSSVSQVVSREIVEIKSKPTFEMDSYPMRVEAQIFQDEMHAKESFEGHRHNFRDAQQDSLSLQAGAELGINKFFKRTVKSGAQGGIGVGFGEAQVYSTEDDYYKFEQEGVRTAFRSRLAQFHVKNLEVGKFTLKFDADIRQCLTLKSHGPKLPERAFTVCSDKIEKNERMEESWYLMTEVPGTSNVVRDRGVAKGALFHAMVRGDWEFKKLEKLMSDQTMSFVFKSLKETDRPERVLNAASRVQFNSDLKGFVETPGWSEER